jgi:hypothetical protein
MKCHRHFIPYKAEEAPFVEGVPFAEEVPWPFAEGVPFAEEVPWPFAEEVHTSRYLMVPSKHSLELASDNSSCNPLELKAYTTVSLVEATVDKQLVATNHCSIA